MPRDALHQLLQRVRRRAFVIAWCERLATAILISTALAFPLFLIAIRNTRSPSIQLCALCAILALTGGLSWCWRFHFSFSQAAALLDRQLKLDDLLTTACSCEQTGDQWHQLIRTLACQRAQSINPAHITLHHFGARAWAGMGLAMMLLISLGMFAAVTSTSSARANVTQPAPNPLPAHSAGQELPPPNLIRPPGLENLSTAGSSSSSSQFATEIKSGVQTRKPLSDPKQFQQPQAQPAAGQSASSTGGSTNPIKPVLSSGNGLTTDTGINDRAGLGGTTSSDASRAAPEARGLADAPVQSDGLPASIQRIDPAYRDIVRDFFLEP